MTDLPSLTARRAFVLGLLATGLAGCSLSLPGFDGMPSGDVTAEAMTKNFLPWVNQLRASHGLPPVSYSRTCELTAVDQAKRMALVGKMNHVTGSESPLARFKRMNMSMPAAENIATQQRTPQRAFQAWVNSPKHLENMLGNYRHVGVAMAASPNSGNQPFWAMDLSQ